LPGLCPAGPANCELVKLMRGLLCSSHSVRGGEFDSAAAVLRE
jgi:hypothetical protein